MTPKSVKNSSVRAVSGATSVISCTINDAVETGSGIVAQQTPPTFSPVPGIFGGQTAVLVEEKEEELFVKEEVAAKEEKEEEKVEVKAVVEPRRQEVVPVEQVDDCASNSLES